jgi:hypothetical protein
VTALQHGGLLWRGLSDASLEIRLRRWVGIQLTRAELSASALIGGTLQPAYAFLPAVVASGFKSDVPASDWFVEQKRKSKQSEPIV